MHMTEEQKAPFFQLLVDYGLVKKDQCYLETHGKEAEAQTAWNKGKALEEKLACMLEDLDIVGEEETALFDELDQKKAQLKKQQAMTAEAMAAAHAECNARVAEKIHMNVELEAAFFDYGRACFEQGKAKAEDKDTTAINARLAELKDKFLNLHKALQQG